MTGAGLKYNAGIFYLVLGQNSQWRLFCAKNGDYNHAGGQFQQYTEKVRAFTLGANLTIKDFRQVELAGMTPACRITDATST